MDKGSPLPALFGELSKKWEPGAGDDKAPKTSVCLLRAATKLDVGDQAKTGRATHDLLCTLAGHHSEGVDLITLLTINTGELVSLLHSLFVITGGKYKEGPGYLWVSKGDIPDDWPPTLKKPTPLHYALNLSIRGTV